MQQLTAHSPSKRRIAGWGFTEAVVAMGVLSMGVLGLLWLQGKTALAWRSQQGTEQAAWLTQDMAERLRATEPRPVAAPDAPTRADIVRANLVIEELVVPWERLFDAIEDADARSLGALSLTPNARDRSVRFAGEARDMNELLAYIERLSAQAALSEVHLQGYNTVVREGQPVLSFTLAATWRPVP